MPPKVRGRFQPWSGLVWWLAILAGLKVLAGAGATADILGDTVDRFLLVICAALDAGTAVVVGANRPHRRRPVPPPDPDR